MKRIFYKLNHYFLHEDPEEITGEVIFYWYGLFGGGVLMSLLVLAYVWM